MHWDFIYYIQCYKYNYHNNMNIQSHQKWEACSHAFYKLFLWEQKVSLHTCMWLWKGWIVKHLPCLGQDIQMIYLSSIKIISFIHFFFLLLNCSISVSSVGVSSSSNNDSGLSYFKVSLNKLFFIQNIISLLENSDQSYQ